MARGWESKSVESQQESARDFPSTQMPSTLVQQKIQALQLSRRRILDEIATSSNPRFRELKNRALLHLEAEIAQVMQGEA